MEAPDGDDGDDGPLPLPLDNAVVVDAGDGLLNANPNPDQIPPPLENAPAAQAGDALPNPNPNPNPDAAIPDHLTFLLPVLFPNPNTNPNANMNQLPPNPDPRFPFLPNLSQSMLQDDLVWDDPMFAGGPWVKPDPDFPKPQPVVVVLHDDDGDDGNDGHGVIEPAQPPVPVVPDGDDVEVNEQAHPPVVVVLKDGDDDIEVTGNAQPSLNPPQLDQTEDKAPEASNAPAYSGGPWILDEKERFIAGVNLYGTSSWGQVSAMVGTRSPKQCRKHYGVYKLKHPDK